MRYIWYYHDPKKYGNMHEQDIDLGMESNALGAFYQAPFAVSMRAIDSMNKSKIYEYPGASSDKKNMRPSLKLGHRGVINPLWQYNSNADPRTGDLYSDFGRVYNTTIRPNDPIVFIQPGKPKFYGLEGFFSTKDEKLREAAIDKMWEGAGGGDAMGGSFGLADLASEFAWRSGDKPNPTKFYDFEPDFNSYRMYVKNILLELMIRMGINNISGFGDIKPMDVSPSEDDPEKFSEKFKKWMGAGWKVPSASAVDVFTKFMDYYGWTQIANAQNAGSGSNLWATRASFLPFRVEKSTSVSDSFSTSTGDSSVASQVKGVADQAKEALFLTQGNSDRQNLNAVAGLADVVAKIAGGVLGGAGMAAGTAGAQNAEVIMKSGGNILFPEIWKDSSYSRSITLQMKLHAPYGNRRCYFESILFPIACCLALSMPKQVGSAVYMSPPLIRMYSKGWFSCDMGMITSLSISRGSDKNDWTIDRLPRTVEISMEVKDLFGTMMLSMGGAVGKKFSIFSKRNTMLTDYLNVLGGIDSFSDSAIGNRMMQKIALLQTNLAKLWSPQFYIGVSRTLVGGVVAKFDQNPFVQLVKQGANAHNTMKGIKSTQSQYGVR